MRRCIYLPLFAAIVLAAAAGPRADEPAGPADHHPVRALLESADPGEDRPFDAAWPYRVGDWPPVGSIGLYVDPDAVEWCVSGPQYAMFDMYYVITPDYMGIRGVEFMVLYPPGLAAIETAFPDFYSTSLGEPAAGIAIVYYTCETQTHWAMRQRIIALGDDPATIRLDAYPSVHVTDIDVAACYNPTRPIRPLHRRTDLDFNGCGGYVWPSLLDSVTVDGASALTLHFADPVEESEAEDTDDYLVFNRLDSAETIDVVSADLLAGGRTVAVALAAPFTPGGRYMLQVSDDIDPTEGANVVRTGTGLCPDLELRGLVPADGGEHDVERFPVRFLIRNGGGGDAGPFTADLTIMHSVSGHHVVLGTYSLPFEGLAAGQSAEAVICADLRGYVSRTIDLFASLECVPDAEVECYRGNNEFWRQVNPHTPRLRSVADIPGDEGGWVRLVFDRALTDVDPSATVACTYYYEFYRRPAGGAPPDCGCEPGPCGEWEFLRSLPAERIDTYSKWAETPCDLAPGSPDCVFDFLVCAVEVTGAGDTMRHWSEVRAGSSIDNLAPAKPTGFAGAQQGEDLYLRWDPNGEPDLGGYRLHRAASLYGPWTLIAQPAGTEHVDEDWFMGSGYCYRLAAVDVHGNQSAPSDLTPEGMVATLLAGFSAVLREHAIALDWTLSAADPGLVFHVLRSRGGGAFEEISAIEAERGTLEFSFVDDDLLFGEVLRYRIEFEDGGGRRILFETEPIETPEMPLTLDQNAPNPFNPSTAISFHLPASSDARLDIFDVTGRRVAVVLDGPLPKGTHRVEWDGRDAAGRQVASGIYFYRLVAGKEVLTRKMVLLR